MSNIEELAFFNANILGKNKVTIGLVKEAMEELHPYSNLLEFADIEKLKKQLDIDKPNFLIIDLQESSAAVKEFIVFLKKRFPKLKILIIGSSWDIGKVRDFFEIGISGFVSAEITLYELKIALQKIFSGEKYVGTGVSGKLINSFFSFQKRV